MRQRRIRVAALAVLATFGTAQATLAQSAADDEPVVLRVGTTANLDNDNPWAVTSGSDWVVATTQYDMLLKFDSEDLSAAPSLAEGCEPSSDHTTWTCTLREGLMWSDGQPVTANDFEFAIKRLFDPTVGVYYAGFFTDIVGAAETFAVYERAATAP